MAQDQRAMTILLIGETGRGKSAFGSAYLQEPNVFRSAATGEGVTDITSCQTRRVNDIYRCVIDTPGFSDPNGQDAVHIADMVRFLRGYNKGVLVIALVVQIFEHRVSQDLQRVIQQLKIMFGNSDIWSHFCIVVTHCQPGVEFNRLEKENLFRPKLVSVIQSVEGRLPPNLHIPVFFVDSLRFQTDAPTQREIQLFHDFAASMQRPVSTNALQIPDEIFAKIEKSKQSRKVNEQPISIPYQAQETYTEQEPYNTTVSWTEQEPYTEQEAYTEQVAYSVEKESHGGRRYGFAGPRSVTRWTETHYRPEARTRTVTKYRPVERTRNEVKYRPVQRTRTVTKLRNGMREFWEETETTKKTFYNGTTDSSVRTLRSWTNDV